VRQGASWTAAYHLQLTVAAVARPVRSSVGALGVLAAERSWLLLALTASARRIVQPISRSGVVAVVDTASRQATASVAGVQHAVSTHPVSASGIRVSSRPVSGHLGSSSRGSGGRPSAVHPSSRLLSTRAVSSRLVSAPVHPDASVSSHLRRWRWEPGRGGRATVTTGTGGGPCGCRAVDGSSDARGGRDAGDAAEVALVSGRSVADPGRRVGCGPRRPRLTTERPGRPGRRAERPSRAALWAWVQAAARGGCTRRVAAVLGWVRDHGAWSSPSPNARVGGPGGATGRAGGDGRAAPARPKPAANAPGSLPAAL
jgi:hypothetical protein